MKRNISLLLGTVIGVLAALSFMQTDSSKYRQILHILTSPLKDKVWKLPEEEARVESYVFKIYQDNYRDEDQRNTKIRDKCFYN